MEKSSTGWTLAETASRSPSAQEPDSSTLYTGQRDHVDRHEERNKGGHSNYHVPEGKITQMVRDEESELLIALTTKSLIMIDAKGGTCVGRRRRRLESSMVGLSRGGFKRTVGTGAN